MHKAIRFRTICALLLVRFSASISQGQTGLTIYGTLLTNPSIGGLGFTGGVVNGADLAFVPTVIINPNTYVPSPSDSRYFSWAGAGNSQGVDWNNYNITNPNIFNNQNAAIDAGSWWPSGSSVTDFSQISSTGSTGINLMVLEPNGQINMAGNITSLNPSHAYPSITSFTVSGALAISSIFSYQGADCLAVALSNGDIKVYNWGTPTPVATLFNAGLNVNGLDVRVKNTNGVINFSTDLEVLTTQTNSTNFYYYSGSGTALGTFNFLNPGGSPTTIITQLNDIVLGPNGKVAAVDYMGDPLVADMSSYLTAAIPEPSTYAALLGMAALGFAANRRRRRQAD